jgi:hypothetical protein
MALQSSGAISFSQIAAEFGGVGSHSLSEYYPLAGLGVTGLSSSGTFSFSQFHGKSKVVTISVWVSSGYNSSTTNWQYRNQGTNNNWSSFYATRNNQWRYNVYFDGFNVITFTGGQTNWGIYSYEPYGSGGIKRSWVTTAWVDTSAYQNQNVNRQITT